MTHRVFVYGSLKRGFHNHRLIEGCKFLGEAQTRGTMVSLGAYPGVLNDGDGLIHGELFEVDDATFKALDRLEGHPSFYRREIAGMEDGSAAWIYYYQHFHEAQVLPIVSEGFWTKPMMRSR